jgi:hypothetical protein
MVRESILEALVILAGGAAITTATVGHLGRTPPVPVKPSIRSVAFRFGGHAGGGSVVALDDRGAILYAADEPGNVHGGRVVDLNGDGLAWRSPRLRKSAPLQITLASMPQI